MNSNCEWSLKNKHGQIITPEEITSEQRSKISKLNREDLFPPQFSIDEIEPVRYNLDGTPKDKRWMNSFMCFRRVLGLYYKRFKIVFNGTELSQLARWIWYGASDDERNIYKQISVELRERHYELLPNYVFRKAPKPADDYINYGPETFEKKRRFEDETSNQNQKSTKRICKKDSDSTNVPVVNESDNKQPYPTDTNSNETWFPYDGQSFKEAEPCQQNIFSDSNSNADYTLWSQSFAPTVDPGMNMPLGIPESIIFHDEIDSMLFYDGANFNTYGIPIPCDVIDNFNTPIYY
ncbi:8826_t:CDS:1 [Gigaspora margarita]|uniref:8826_t:CDS:1 n=1 Tax=Gigaspora margarita TaxID=4874 RepID=A0ABM8VXZ6_GIGMA|nr:8826_t:CDS:1 [Gigaspora margarita]